MPLKIFKRGDSPTWHYRGTIEGVRLRGSTGTADKPDAQRLVAELEHREWQRHRHGPEAVLTFVDAVTIYLDGRRKEHFGLAKLVKHWRLTLVKDIKPSMIRDAAPKLYPRAKPATWNRAVLTPTAAIINYAAEKEPTPCQPIKVKKFLVEKPLKEPASWTWVEEFARHSSSHLGALAIFMFLTGARVSEAITLTWTEVSLSGSRALIRSGKTKTSRQAHLPPVLIAALANLPMATGSDRVFGYKTPATARFAWERTIRQAGLKRLLPHACRHGFATALLRAGVDVITVSKLGGWSTPQHVFQTYGHASDDMTLTDRIVGAYATPNGVNPLKKKG